MHDHVTLLSPARIERGIAKDNFTPILSRTRSSGFNVFGLRMGLRSRGLKASKHGGSDARAAGCQSRSGVPLQTPSESSWINELCPALPFTRSPALWTGVCQLPPTRRLANFRVARYTAEGPIQVVRTDIRDRTYRSSTSKMRMIAPFIIHYWNSEDK
jgi:hypothetical protein